MLKEQQPEIVSVGPRWTDCHLEMVLKCLEAGAHVYCEKPMTWNLADGDQIVAKAKETGKKVAVAHQGASALPSWDSRIGAQRTRSSGMRPDQLLVMRLW